MDRGWGWGVVSEFSKREGFFRQTKVFIGFYRGCPTKNVKTLVVTGILGIDHPFSQNRSMENGCSWKASTIGDTPHFIQFFTVFHDYERKCYFKHFQSMFLFKEVDSAWPMFLFGVGFAVGKVVWYRIPLFEILTIDWSNSLTHSFWSLHIDCSQHHQTYFLLIPKM